MAVFIISTLALHYIKDGERGTLKCKASYLTAKIYSARPKGGPLVAWMLQAKPGRSDKQQQEQNSTNLGTKWITAHLSEVFATHRLKTEEGAACLTVLAARLPSRKEGKVEVQPSKAGPSNQVSCSLFCLHFWGGNQVTRSVEASIKYPAFGQSLLISILKLHHRGP